MDAFLSIQPIPILPPREAPVPPRAARSGPSLSTQGPSWGYFKVNFYQVCRLLTKLATKWLQERGNGSKTGNGIPPRRAFCGPCGAWSWVIDSGLVRSPAERRCSDLGPAQSRISPSARRVELARPFILDMYTIATWRETHCGSTRLGSRNPCLTESVCTVVL